MAQKTVRQLSMNWEQFSEQYMPVQNYITTRGECNGWLFETYGADHEEILKLAAHPTDQYRVWTFMTDDNGNICISNGYSYVNRLGYIVTQLPVAPDTFVFVQDEDDILNEDETN